MSRRLGRHNIIGNEVGRPLKFEFSSRRWHRRRRDRQLGFWLCSLAVVIALIVGAGLLRWA